MSKLAIIDPVGIKAGMNCYDLGLLNALHQQGIETFAFSNFKDNRFPGVQQFSFFLKTKQNLLSNTLNFAFAHLNAMAICRRNEVHWVILHVFSTTAKDVFSFHIARLSGAKIIAIIHDVNSLSNEDNPVFRQKMYDMAEILIVHNQTSFTEISAILTGAQQQKLRIVPHGNYLDFITGEHTTRHFANEIVFDDKYKYLLFFGQIKKVKGLDVLLRAMALLPKDFKLIVAGRPHRDNFSDYEHLINELGISDNVISCIRFISDDERDYLFKKCDALVLPYRKIFQSGVLLLAMSYGLPVVASNLPANAEIIEDGTNGYLFEDGNAEELAGRIMLLFANQKRHEIQINIKNTAETRFGWDNIAAQYKKMIKITEVAG